MQTICFENSDLFYNLHEVHQYIEKLHSQETTLQKLTQLFGLLKNKVKPEQLFSDKFLPKGHSHFKEIFLNVSRPEGQLIFEALYFTGEKATIYKNMALFSS